MRTPLPWGREYLMVTPTEYRIAYTINPFMDPEILGNDGINSDSGGFSERIPAPISLRAALRITF